MKPRRILSSPHATAGCLLGLGVLALFADLLLFGDGRIVSFERGDGAFYFSRIRAFAFGEMARGNLPLWNPHVYSGHPLFGTLQPALLYPPNLVYLLLPISTAMNLDAALHLFLTAFLSFAWARGRGFETRSALLVGAIVALCGATSLRLMAGQLSVLAGNAWLPAVLLAVERSLERPSPGWLLLGVAALTLQLLAGYPFCVLATALTAGCVALLRVRRIQRPGPSLAALAVLCVAPLLLAAVQLLPALEVSAESTRAGGTRFAFASRFSFPTENLLTALVPAFFGDLVHIQYWGREYFWDASIYFGAPVLFLAAFGLRGARARSLDAAPLALLLLVLALGSELPFYQWLHASVPGFDRFRAPSKFLFAQSLFVALLAAEGLEALRRRTEPPRLALGLAIGLGALLLLLAAAIPLATGSRGEPGLWDRLVKTVAGVRFYTPEFARETASFASGRLLRATVPVALLAALLAVCGRRRRAAGFVALLGVAQLFAFAREYRSEFHPEELRQPELWAFVESHRPGRDRFYDFRPTAESWWGQANWAVEAGAHSIWGYDPVQSRRYITFLGSLWRGRYVEAQPLQILAGEPHPRMAILRTRYVVAEQGVEELSDPLPRFLLLREYRVLDEPGIVETLLEESFDPRRTALLESEPQPAPDAGGSDGSVRALEESTDHLVLEVELSSPALLLVTDAYAGGWRAFLETGAPQRELPVLPADLVLRAVALPAGAHRLRLEYAPPGFRVGRWISLASLGIYAGCAGAWGLSRMRS